VQEVRIITSFPGPGNYEANPGLKSTPKTSVHAGSELTNIFLQRKIFQIVFTGGKIHRPNRSVFTVFDNSMFEIYI